MEDKLIICPRCTSDACYEKTEDSITQYMCFGCGFSSNSLRHKSLIDYEEIEKSMPNLYKDLRYIDDEGLVWYPVTINISDKGMVFADGSNVTTWKWGAVLATPITKKEKAKFPAKTTHKMDMTTLNHFDGRDFMEALDFISYFNQ